MDPHLFNYFFDSFIVRIFLAGMLGGALMLGLVGGCVWLYNNLSISWAT